MHRLHQSILITSVILFSWLGMQGVHEFGHVLGARLTGGHVNKVVWHPSTISRTDLDYNPNPLLVVWAGPIIGVLVPLALWGGATRPRWPGAFVFRFFAGFCLIANGAYIAFGSFDNIGDCGPMRRHGSPIWTLWLFGALTIPLGLWLWHRQGEYFGLGPAKGKVNRNVAYCWLVVSVLLVVVSLVFGGE
jgi:hypothetical protein